MTSWGKIWVTDPTEISLLKRLSKIRTRYKILKDSNRKFVRNNLKIYHNFKAQVIPKKVIQNNKHFTFWCHKKWSKILKVFRKVSALTARASSTLPSFIPSMLLLRLFSSEIEVWIGLPKCEHVWDCSMFEKIMLCSKTFGFDFQNMMFE